MSSSVTSLSFITSTPRKVEGVDVMKDKEVKLDDMKTSLTQDGVGEGRVQGRRNWRGCR